MSAELPRAGDTTPGERTDARSPDASDSTLTVAEAASHYRVSVATLRRKLRDGAIAGACKQPGPKGEEWRLPITSLTALGYRDLEQARSPQPPLATPESLRVDRLRERLQEAERRAELSEALASERLRALDDLRIALRALAQMRPRPRL